MLCKLFDKVCLLARGVSVSAEVVLLPVLVRGENAMSYVLAHMAVPYGGPQDACLEPKYIQCSM
jgi:hypothetical protein